MSDTGTGSDDVGNDTDGPQDTGTVAVYDPYADLARSSNCEDFDGTPYNGATSFFVGEFSFDEGVLTGHEDWVLFANNGWQQNGGSDCFLRWDAFGTISGPSDCVGCSHEISIDLTFDGETSNCVQELENFEGNDGNVTYYVQAQPSGEARWEFASGTFLGEGVLGEGRAAYATDGTCTVF